MFAVSTIFGYLSLNSTHCTYNGTSRSHDYSLAELDFVEPQKLNASMYRFANRFTIDFEKCVIYDYPIYQGVFRGYAYTYDCKGVHFSNGSAFTFETKIAPHTFYSFDDVLVNPALGVYFDLKTAGGKALRFDSCFNLTSLHRNDYFEEQVYDFDADNVLSFSNGDFVVLSKASLAKQTYEPIVIEKVVEKVVEKIVEKQRDCPIVDCDNKALYNQVNQLQQSYKQSRQAAETCKGDLQHCYYELATSAAASVYEKADLRQKLEEEMKSKNQVSQELKTCQQSVRVLETDPGKMCSREKPSDKKLRRLQLTYFGLTCVGLVGLFVFVAMM